MLHKQREWQIFSVASAEWLATALAESTWCGCNGFSLSGYLFVNDATNADGAQEYAVLLKSEEQYVQIESLTFSWMSPEQVLRIIRRVLTGAYDTNRYDVVDLHQIQTPGQHGECHFCR